ncbi:emopamil binding protein [Talaromyces proteolyticus]|uniref:Emopamil binding protein n=1 Tax=Talaromyces proteolyticus TaxID=1131652 RepID=A0AAD4PXP3_9EURO|nr:emopamil binding protein [Talaromyces proteolyticus]KAH8692943.1 emopamil binding protein [Talaromyces proteolyticus]
MPENCSHVVFSCFQACGRLITRIPGYQIHCSKTMANTSDHPLYPPDINIPLGYVSNTISLTVLLSSFALATLAIITFTLAILKGLKPTISRPDKILVGWFIFTGSIHFFLEGYFVYHHRTMPRMQDLFGQLWKEYAKADSRYMTIEPFVLIMESITAFAWGPLSYLIAWMIVVKSPYRHPTQMLVSMGQFYGDVLYYGTSMLEEYYHARSYSRPERYYYWGYFIFLNAFWIFIPAWCMYQSYSAMVAVSRLYAGYAGKKTA